MTYVVLLYTLFGGALPTCLHNVGLREARKFSRENPYRVARLIPVAEGRLAENLWMIDGADAPEPVWAKAVLAKGGF